MSKLIVNPTSSNRREILLSRTTILTIGRDPSNDLVLPDAMVSRRHAVVEHRGKQFFLRDCSSANGSVVNGDRVSERPLRDGDLVAIGSMRLLFRDEVVGGDRRQGARAPLGGAARVPHVQVCLPARRPLLPRVRRAGGAAERAAQGGVRRVRGLGPAAGALLQLLRRDAGARTGSASRSRPPRARPDDRSDTQPVPIVSPEQAPRASGPFAMAPPRPRSPCPSSQPTPAPQPREPPRGAPRATGDASRPQTLAPPRERELAEPGSRLAAFVVDTVFVVSGQAVLLAPVVWYWWARETPRTPSDVALLPVIASVTLLPLALLLGVLYHVYFWSVKGATPGKELLDLRVVTDDGGSPIPLASALRRALGYLLSAASLGLGFLMVVFGGRGLHDRIASTRVVKGTRR